MSIRLIFLWHMHQPYYKDLVTGEYRLPWVRLHGLKDYYGMVKLLDEFPSVHQTFNIVPSLMRQIEDYCSGAARDPFLDVAAKPAADLTPEEGRFALQYLFQANPTHMIGRYPRYRELWERFRGFAYEPSRAQPSFSPQDITDLQVLSQIAWFDEFFLQEPEIAELIHKERNFTLDDQRFVIQQQQRLLAEVLPAYKSAAERGGIEISTSPFYHPILPLLCDTDIGAVSSPGLPLPGKRFQHPEDAREQLLRGLDLHQQVFGVRPQGVWPSEGSVSEAALQIGHELGVRWMATDEGVLGRTLNTSFQRGGGDRLSAGSAETLYNIYRYENNNTEMNLIFRDHALSDLLGFVYSGMPSTAAVQHLMQHIKESAHAVGSGQDAIVPIILDGENAWEHYPESGRDFLRRLYDAIAQDPEMEATTASEAIARHRNFGNLDHLTPGSWINANFNVWIGAPEDNKSWEHLADARQFFDEAAPNAKRDEREMAFEELLIAEGSDWNWWYGPEHHSANDREFDELYRKHLSNVYQALGGTPPEALAQPIATMGASSHFVPQTAYIHPRLHEQIAHYFDWVGAAMYTADRTTSAMHGKRFYLDSVLAGVDESSLYVQLEFTGGAPPAPDETYAGYQVVLTCERVTPNAEPQTGDTTRISVEIQSGKVEHWDVTRARDGQAHDGDQELRPADTPPNPAVEAEVAPGDAANHPDLRFRLEKTLEMQVPLALLHAQMGDTLRLRLTMWRARLPIDALPLEGSIDLRVVSEEELSAAGY